MSEPDVRGPFKSTKPCQDVNKFFRNIDPVLWKARSMLQMGLFFTFLLAKTFLSFPDITLDGIFSGIDFLVLHIGV